MIQKAKMNYVVLVPNVVFGGKVETVVRLAPLRYFLWQGSSQTRSLPKSTSIWIVV